MLIYGLITKPYKLRFVVDKYCFVCHYLLKMVKEMPGFVVLYELLVVVTYTCFHLIYNTLYIYIYGTYNVWYSGSRIVVIVYNYIHLVYDSCSMSNVWYSGSTVWLYNGLKVMHSGLVNVLLVVAKVLLSCCSMCNFILWYRFTLVYLVGSWCFMIVASCDYQSMVLTWDEIGVVSINPQSDLWW